MVRESREITLLYWLGQAVVTRRENGSAGMVENLIMYKYIYTFLSFK